MNNDLLDTLKLVKVKEKEKFLEQLCSIVSTCDYIERFYQSNLITPKEAISYLSLICGKYPHLCKCNNKIGELR